jgi:hypothetical protein
VSATQKHFETLLKQIPQLNNLAPRRLKAVTNFMAVLPTIDQESCTQRRAISGWVAIGVLERRGAPWPKFEVMVYDMCRRDLTQAEKFRAEHKFAELLDEQYRQGPRCWMSSIDKGR